MAHQLLGPVDEYAAGDKGCYPRQQKFGYRLGD